MKAKQEVSIPRDAPTPPTSLIQRFQYLVKHLPGRLRLSPSTSLSLRSVFLAFTLTRLIILSIFIIVGHTKVAYDPTGAGVANADLKLRKVPVARILRNQVQSADGNWYLGIASSGYERKAFDDTDYHNWVFFPLYPVLLRSASWLTGELPVTGILLSHVFFFFALLFLHKTALAFGLDPSAANRTIFYLAIFPASYFFSLPLTESLFLLLTVATFYWAKTDRWWLAGLCGALATATRSMGVVLMPALALMYIEQYRTLWPPRKALLAICLVPTGLLSFMIFLRAITGNALAFAGALKAWGRAPSFFLFPLLDYLLNPLDVVGPWNPNFLNFGAATMVLICGVVLLRRRLYSLACYTLLSELIALSTVMLQSQARYAMVVFPAFMVVATWGRNSTFDTILRTISIALLTVMSGLFAAHFSLAMA